MRWGQRLDSNLIILPGVIVAPVSILFLIIFLEGYVVLSTELLAIRLMIPFAGSGADIVSVVIAAVLLPLAFGYYRGGHARRKNRYGDRAESIRKRLIFNLMVSSVILTFGLSYVFLDSGLDIMRNFVGMNNRVLLTVLYSLFFLITPVYLLGQTIPLISHYFPRAQLPVAAGRILFFSTLGSFAGALFSTLVLMPLFGVHIAVIVTIGCLTVLTILLQRRKVSFVSLGAVVIFMFAIWLNSPHSMSNAGILSNNQYNTLQVIDYDLNNIRVMMVNKSYASVVFQDKRDTNVIYNALIEKNFIGPAAIIERPLSILVLGAGGFAIGRKDMVNQYTFVDLDKNLKDVAEEYFLKEKLTENKTFVPMEARAFLLQSKDKYDLIVIDLFRDYVTMPDDIMVHEFFRSVKDHLKEDGVMAANFVVSPFLSDKYSKNIDTTIRSVFPYLNREVAGSYSPWNKSQMTINVLYSAQNGPDHKPVVYTDNKNPAVYDRASATRSAH